LPPQQGNPSYPAAEQKLLSYELVMATRDNFIFTSPFIKVSAVNMIMEGRKHNFSVKGITSFRLRNFDRGASDMEGLLSDADKSFDITEEIIAESENILNSIP